MNKICFECGNKSDVDHHVVPQSKGGTKTVPLCAECHSLVHDAKLMSIAELTKQGKNRIRELDLRSKIVEMYQNGISKNKISSILKIRRGTVYYILTACGLHKNTGRGNKEVITPESLKEITRLRRKKCSWPQIAKKTGISLTHLNRMLDQRELRDGIYGGKSKNRRFYKTLTSDQINKAKELRDHKLTWQQIADTLGVDRTTLYRNNLPQQFKPLRGSLTKNKKKTAIDLRKNGLKWKEIAKALEVSVSTLYFNNIHKE